jgi:hypothetical protein
MTVVALVLVFVLILVIVGALLDYRERRRDLDYAIAALSDHGDAMESMAAQQVALRKQIKYVLKGAEQINATHRRYLIKQRAVLLALAHLNDDPDSKTRVLVQLEAALKDKDVDNG